MIGAGLARIMFARIIFPRTWAAAMLVALPAVALAQSPAEFYKGRNVDLQIGYSAGGGYDLYARMIARHIGRHIPGNPTVIARNMEGAGSLRLANWLYTVAPRDGTVFGATSRGMAFDPLLSATGASFEASKFNWIGSANDEVSVCVATDRSGIATFGDLYTKPLSIGSTGAADDTYQFPAVINGALGTRFKIITGYPGGNDVSLAMERDEVQGRCGWSWSSIKATRMDWVKSRKIIVLVQMSLGKHPDLPDIPLVTDLAKNDEQRQIFKLIFARQVMGRPYMAPPGVPKERVDALRRAFDETMTDPEFLAEAGKAQFEITPVAGARLDALVSEVYKTPAAIAAKAAALAK
jgi:tripartite-type tricarboxylate transporter receptor subunit TctC